MQTTKLSVISSVCFLLATVVVTAADEVAEVSEVRSFRQPDSACEILRGEVALPADGLWAVQSVTDRGINQFYVVPPLQTSAAQTGRRMYAALRERRINAGRSKVSSVYRGAAEIAKANNGVGPAAFADYTDKRHKYIQTWVEQPPWRNLEDMDGQSSLKGPFVFLVPRAKFHFVDEDTRQILAGKREILAVELRPYVDDGKHWVLYTDGTTLRQPLDQQFVSQHDIEILPVVKETTPQERQATLKYVFVAVRTTTENAPEVVEITMNNAITGEEKTVHWPVSVKSSDESVVDSRELARKLAARPYLQTGPAPVMRSWTKEVRPDSRPPGRELSMFSLLGGRAAIEETLQLQDLAVVARKKTSTISMGAIEGVTVKAHPFEQMLGDRPGGRLPLANTVPPDRFIVYVAQPTAILPMLEKGGGFVASIGAGLTGNQLHYNLVEKYLDRMGMNRAWIEAAIRSGLTRELIVSTPDLFFIDGTDVTVTAKLANVGVLNPVLRLLGIKGLAEGSVLNVKTRDGRDAYWALRGDLLSISTNRAELQQTLDLIDQNSSGSLGQSDEFRYMLTQVPIQPTTRIFAYLSDPFVRRLVGPQTKLAQLRRLRTRAVLEELTAQLLLARADGRNDIESIEDLARQHYIPQDFSADGYSIDEKGHVQSDVYGSLARLETLPSVPLQDVTEDEADAYRRYREDYSRYWRQFFDPIAVRLDDASDGGLELTTFILPLIDSSIYNQLRESMRAAEDGGSLPMPKLQPQPILMFSANLAEKAWQDVANNASDFFRRYSGASPALLDDLGPSAHIAIHDADPVITLGSGDVLGAFGGNVLRGRGSTMIMLPVALSVLTRPCTILVETRDAERTARFLRQAAQGRRAADNNDRDFRTSFYQVEGRDAWVWTSDIVGVVKLRFGVEVTDRYLVIRNIPWSTNDQATGEIAAPLVSANLSVFPAACQKQLPGLFAAATDQQRKSVMSGLGRLYPFMLAGARNVEAAAAEHETLFGFRPIISANDRWTWDRFQMASAHFGTPRQQRQPAFNPNAPFGLLQQIETLQLSMQFEDAGLRSIVRWRLRESK